MKIGIIGAGQVGGTLAKKWLKKGHSVVAGVSDLSQPDSVQKVKSIHEKLGVASLQDAVRSSDVVVLAVPWAAAEEVVKGLAPLLSGKILIDCTNPLKKDLSGLTVGLNSSGGEQVQSWAPGAYVVKSFHTTGFNIMADPMIDGRRAVMFQCSHFPDAKQKVKALIEDVGFEEVDAGPLTSARLLEPYALLWISCAYQFSLGRDFAFSLLRKTH